MGDHGIPMVAREMRIVARSVAMDGHGIPTGDRGIAADDHG